MSEFTSWQDYQKYAYAVRHDRCFVRSAASEAFLAGVRATASSREVTLQEGRIFWRAQLGHDWRKETHHDEEFEVPCPHAPSRMKPLRNRASEGRANPKGIPHLYMATTKEAAMSEVRPWLGSKISVGQFKLLKSVRLIDCSREHNRSRTMLYLEEPTPEEIVRSVWADIDGAFAEPMTRSDNTADYVATQIIAELFKDAGYEGVAYKSAFGETGFNIAVFDIDAADLINCHLYCVENIDMKFSMESNPYFIRNHYEKLQESKETK